jgi:hypothetical protein
MTYLQKLRAIEAEEARNWGGCDGYYDGCRCPRCLTAWERQKQAWRELYAEEEANQPAPERRSPHAHRPWHD